METTRQQKQIRAIRMNEMVSELITKVAKQIQDEGVLPSPDIVAVFAAACAMSIVHRNESDRELGSDMAQTALRIIIKNLKMHHVSIPDLEMDEWVTPNVQPGNDKEH